MAWEQNTLRTSVMMTMMNGKTASTAWVATAKEKVCASGVMRYRPRESQGPPKGFLGGVGRESAWGTKRCYQTMNRKWPDRSLRKTLLLSAPLRCALPLRQAQGSADCSFFSSLAAPFGFAQRRLINPCPDTVLSPKKSITTPTIL